MTRDWKLLRILLFSKTEEQLPGLRDRGQRDVVSQRQPAVLGAAGVFDPRPRELTAF